MTAGQHVGLSRYRSPASQARLNMFTVASRMSGEGNAGSLRHTDPIAYADLRTSLHDWRAALCLAIGVPVDRIDPCTGHSPVGWSRRQAVQLELEAA